MSEVHGVLQGVFGRLLGMNEDACVIMMTDAYRDKCYTLKASTVSPTKHATLTWSITCYYYLPTTVGYVKHVNLYQSS